MQTEAGIELHEEQFHGYKPIGTRESVASTIDMLGGAGALSIPITQQVSFLQDEIFIQESLDRVCFS